MAIYTGTIKANTLYAKLDEILKAEGYTEISSEQTTDGRVYKSVGVDGDNEFYISLKNPNNAYLTAGVHEKYVPNANIGLPGTYTNGYETTGITWNTGSLNSDRVTLHYIINATKERVIVYVQGRREEANTASSITYLGLPKRYDTNDKSGSFAGLGCTTRYSTATSVSWKALRNRAMTQQFLYTIDQYMPAKSYGWGGKLFFSPIFIGSVAEGMRGELDSLYIVEKADKDTEVYHGDRFVKDGKTYVFISPTSHGTHTLSPSYDYVMEI